MLSFEKLVELFSIATEWKSTKEWALGSKPTAHSVEIIQTKLAITIPKDYILLASMCPSYAMHLAGIGEDFDSAYHILQLNHMFHDVFSPALPPWFVMLDHGSDGDCDCWDIRRTAASGEHPIVYVGLEGHRPSRAGEFQDFRSYIENYAVMNAISNPKSARRKRAKDLFSTQSNKARKGDALPI